MYFAKQVLPTTVQEQIAEALTALLDLEAHLDQAAPGFTCRVLTALDSVQALEGALAFNRLPDAVAWCVCARTAREAMEAAINQYLIQDQPGMGRASDDEFREALAGLRAICVPPVELAAVHLQALAALTELSDGIAGAKLSAGSSPVEWYTALTPYLLSQQGVILSLHELSQGVARKTIVDAAPLWAETVEARLGRLQTALDQVSELVSKGVGEKATVESRAEAASLWGQAARAFTEALQALEFCFNATLSGQLRRTCWERT